MVHAGPGGITAAGAGWLVRASCRYSRGLTGPACRLARLPR
jgi:hypothetical protein